MILIRLKRLIMFHLNECSLLGQTLKNNPVVSKGNIIKYFGGMYMGEKSPTNNNKTRIGKYELIHTRIFEAPRELVFEAWTNPEYLEKWWGPNGFTNSFRKFEMQPGGTWEFTMHSPDGTDFPNKVIFDEINKPERIVLNHVSGPRYKITAIFEDIGSKTRLTWRQIFETAQVFDTVKKFAEPGNEENLDRLEVQLVKMQHLLN